MKNDTIYVKYRESLQNLENDPSIFKNFKNYRYFNEILEHTDFVFGTQYKALIEKEFNRKVEEFVDIVNLNDSIGNPARYDFDGLVMSPSNLRYIYHALLLENKCKKWFTGKKKISVLEIGGGYGGLCLFMKKIFKDFEIDYTIIDLPEPSALQNKFFAEAKLSDAKSISQLDIETIVGKKYDLVISNYCISEIGRENQEEYFKKIINNCDKKFFIWNYLTKVKKFFFIKTFDIDLLDKSDYIVEPERPLTSHVNEFIYSK